MTDFAPAISFAKSLRVSGPISSPILSAGILSEGTTSVSIAASMGSGKAEATTVSTGRSSFLPSDFALASISLQYSIFSSSTSEVPISPPCALMKVYAMPPPIISVSHFSSRLEITPSLSATFAPPRIATNGRAGCSSVSAMTVSSFSMRKPQTAVFTSPASTMPAVEACERCAVPNASFTYTSA